MKKNVLVFFLYVLIFSSCKKDPKVINPQDYPLEVGNIIVGKCATSGCHNNKSFLAADGLNLSTWENLFKGDHSGGAVVIPYRSDLSSLCYFINSFPDLGIILEPNMPLNSEPLSKEEYITIRDWIDAGAPNANGKIKFAEDPNRKKMYVANKACDVVTVFDSESLLPMRYINVGNKSAVEYPEYLKVSPDKKNWYVSFFNPSNVIQKFNASNDKLVGELNIGTGSWSSFVISSDSRYGFFADNTSSGGKIVYADLEFMIPIATYTLNFQLMRGVVLNESLKKLYVGTDQGNFIYKIDISNPLSPIISEVPIDGSSTVQYTSSLDPTSFFLDASTDRCYIACKGSNELRTINMQTDAVINTISLGASPIALSYSQFEKKIFIACPDDSLTFSGTRGAVVVFDVQTNTIAKKINSGYQPFGIDVDDQRRIVTVANANLNSGGPAPHHVNACGGRNGYVTFIDMKTMELIPNKRPEVAAFPSSVSSR